MLNRITPNGAIKSASWRNLLMATSSSATSAPLDSAHPDRSGVAVKAVARIFVAWRLNTATSARLIDVSERTFSRMRNGDWLGSLNQDQLMRTSAIVGIYKGLHLYFSDELADRWIKLPNEGPLFLGQAPVSFMDVGGLPAIIETRNYIDAVRGGL